MRTSRARATSGTAKGSTWGTVSRTPSRAGSRSRGWGCERVTVSSSHAGATRNARSGSSASSWGFPWRSSASSSWPSNAMRVLSVVGARPNFLKLAPVDRELVKRGVEHVIVHTGQHYDPGMSDAFFEQLWIPAPDHNLGVGSGSHAQQTAAVMQRLEPVIVESRPDLVLTYGDVNSTVAAALVAAKLQVRVGHVEAGLRSRDWTMPEEINRVVTDAVSDLLFTPSRDADENLLREGVAPERIHLVGNVMIDCLLAQLPKTEDRDTLPQFGVEAGHYATLTLHRPSNVDDPKVFGGIVDVMVELAQEL